MREIMAMVLAGLVWVAQDGVLQLDGYPISISPGRKVSGNLYTLIVRGNRMGYMNLENAKKDGERYAHELDQFGGH